MKTSIAISFILLTTGISAWRLDQDFYKIDWKFGENSIEVTLEADYNKMKKSLAVQWKINPETECPSFVLWWDKSEVKYPSLSVTAGCKQGDKEPIMRWELIGDWDREYDKIETVDGVEKFMFKGIRKFESPIKQWNNGDQNLNNMRIILDGDKREDHNYKID